MFVRRLTIWFLVFVTSGLVGLSGPIPVQGFELFPCNPRTEVCASSQDRSYKRKLKRLEQIGIMIIIGQQILAAFLGVVGADNHKIFLV